MISVSGIRGIVGEALTSQGALKYAEKFGIYSNCGKIIIGRDSRTTGQMLFNAISAGLMSVGCDVVNLGICSTPTVLLAVEQSDASGGIAITASHNPPEWNAMKFISHKGIFLLPKEANEFLSITNDEIIYKNWQQIGKLSDDNMAIERHIKKILEIPFIDIQKIRNRKFKVVIDSTNGAGGTISPKLLNQLGCQVIEMNSETTGIFSREPEPIAENLSQLEKKVKQTYADIGFATDPDVDRLSIVSDKGIALGTEFSLLLVENFVLSKKLGSIATNISSSMSSEVIAKKYGVKIFRTPVGEANVVQAILQHNCVIGGEGNGGIILPEVHCTRDAPVGMALILAYLADTDNTISQLAQEIPHYYMKKEKIKVGPDKLNQVMETAKNVFKNKKLDFTDGMKVIDKDYWIHIRKSGTEPIIRVIVEAKTKQKANEICKDAINKITNI